MEKKIDNKIEDNRGNIIGKVNAVNHNSSKDLSGEATALGRTVTVEERRAHEANKNAIKKNSK